MIILLSWVTSGLLFFAVTAMWGMVERRYRLNGDAVDVRFRVFCGCLFALSCYVIAWPIPPDEPWLIVRAAIGRALLIGAVVSIGHLMATYDRHEETA